MKKIYIILILSFILVGCSGISEEEYNTKVTELENTQKESTMVITNPPTPTPIPEPTPVSQKVLTYDEIKTGKYNNKQVYIKCLLTKISYDKTTNFLEFDAWIKNNKNFINDDLWIIDMEDNENLLNLLKAKEGSVYKFCVEVYPDASFGGTSIISAEKLNDIDVNKVYKQYKENCGIYTCDEILRNPKKYYSKTMKFSGEIFQIISQTDDNVTFLLDTKEKNGYIYVNYYHDETNERLLEGDNITVYGIYYKLFKYSSIIGTNESAPELFAKFIELN